MVCDGGAPEPEVVADAVRAWAGRGNRYVSASTIANRLDGFDSQDWGVRTSVGKRLSQFADDGALDVWSADGPTYEIVDCDALPGEAPTVVADGGGE